jgi:hypothetical protein
MKKNKVIRLTENDLVNIIKKVLMETSEPQDANKLRNDVTGITGSEIVMYNDYGFNRYTGEKKLLKAELIFLDTAHNGDFENQVLNYLNNNNYKGILLIDDIYWNGKMYYFWSAIKNRKIDLTFIGHGDGDGPNGNISGTGIVDFNNNIEIDDYGVNKRLSTRIKISYLKLKYFFKSIFIKNRFKN